MKILVVATKSPWPPQDGGRLALWLTMQGLAAAGHELMLVAPVESGVEARCAATFDALQSVCVPHLLVSPRRHWLGAVSSALATGRSLSVVRHRAVVIEEGVARCVASWRPHLIHVEQLQALANCDAARAAKIPIVLRMQNIESSLWNQVARLRTVAWPLRWEARRLRREERRALRVAARVVALTESDARQLREMEDINAESHVFAVAPAFPRELDCAMRLEGAPSIVLAGSTGWWPNEHGIRWFADAVMPLLTSRVPTARAHVFGGPPIDRVGILWHRAPAEAIDAFPAASIVAIPLHVGSGIRMRILDAWARGLPVVATSVAAAGLPVVSGRELLIADSAVEFVDAIRRLGQDESLRQTLVAAGRLYLARHHDGVAVTADLLRVYGQAVSATGS
ncbi:MAG: glycosyltransferase [Dokdonella sp.]